MDTIDIVLIIISTLILVGLLVLILLLLKKNNHPNEMNGDAYKSFGAIDTKMDNLKETLKGEIKDNVTTQMNEIIIAEKNQSEIISNKITELYKAQGEQNEKSIKAINDLKQDVQEKLVENFKSINDRVNKNLSEGFAQNSDTITKVNQSLGKLEEAKKNLDALQEQVTSLNGVLSNNKSLGRFGELSLENLLHDTFGDTQGCYAFQYQIKDKETDINSRPDAVVFMPDPIKILCIDSKFNFQTYKDLYDNLNTEKEVESKRALRDALKGEITKISSDYIIRGKTAEYAILYVPSDAIYGYIQSDDELYTSVVTYARSKKVVISSPSTLQPILANLNILKFNINTRKNIDKIIKELDSLRKEYVKFTEAWDKLSGEVASLSDKTSKFDTSVTKIGSRLERINTIAPSEDEKTEDKPQELE
jgi:Uncharacterized protein conserved in bacteria